MNYEKELNERQLEAVTSSYQHLRIIAGAGSGKTRVLTYRIAYLIDEMHVEPWKILAITFTNKVAGEMKTRITNMLPNCSKDLTIRTFHSFAANFLRREISVLGFPTSFTILDEEDQTRLLKDIVVEFGYKKGDKIVGIAANYIGSCKLNEKYPDDIGEIIKARFPDEKECLEIYRRYEEEKNKMFSLDFDDLLLKTNYILEHYIDIRLKWQQKIDHILVDEFQDTNNIEYKLIKYLLKPYTCVYVVGDPDQTIYTWRGANQNILLKMNEKFPDIETVILDRNYRSTQNILNSANKLIAFNKERVKKDLYTVQNPGEKIVVKNSGSGQAEADYVSREINYLVRNQGYSLRDICILYRSNYLTLDFERSLMSHQIPYRIYGGQKFYQRREIKDVLAYFHLIVNTKDDISFKRIINVPRRGIGEQTENNIYKEAKEAGKSIYEYLRDVEPSDSTVSKKSLDSLKAMIQRIEIARNDIDKTEEVFSKILEDMIYGIGYYDYILKEDDGDERSENIKALFEDIRHYSKSNPESSFDDYLQNIALVSAQDEILDGDFVNLMTVHTAKGLEFPVVFIVKLNQGIFPNNRALQESGFKGLEEERRLAYVAMTRAKKRLYITLSNSFSYVVGSNVGPSQFIKESGNVAEEPYRQNTWSSPKRSMFDDGPNFGFESDIKPSIKQDFNEPETNGVDSWKIGDIVIHKKLGKGKVIALEGDDIITVEFEEHGRKSILGNHPAVSKGGSDA
ncbi:MAG: UvrD-helicase domain-containing protein [Bacilli bacterium]|nr:UvrD-helicase domain-containing protein [Bacilli bacterium]